MTLYDQLEAQLITSRRLLQVLVRDMLAPAMEETAL
jgi:hypothetical protein